ncbi:MAG: phage portal protein [Sideroxydans sp.]|nr:phage portal protein [Sideroxydans sp.]
MAVVQSLGELQNVDLGWQPVSGHGWMRLYDEHYADYATLYRTQPNVRTCVDFLARNIAQLGLHLYRRVSDTDRERVRDHPLAELLEQPLPAAMKMTPYRWKTRLMADLGIYFRSYQLIVRTGSSRGLLPVPPPLVTVKGALWPQAYEVNFGAQIQTYSPEQMVDIWGYSPDRPSGSISPLETLRRILAEEAAMGDYREQFWRNSARMQGIIQRPADAPPWSEMARERFQADWAALYSGGENSGKTAVLQDGMEWKEASFNAQESEYLAARKLTREECTREYHIPLPMVGILDHATFSNIKEQHKNLYQDCLSPWLRMIEQDLMLQLMPQFEDTEGLYLEFNIEEKLRGSFEEQMQSFQMAVGRPYMTPNEARGKLNLPAIEGGDDLVIPLNMLMAGQGSPGDGAPPPDAEPKARSMPGRKAERGELDPTLPELREQHRTKWRQVLEDYFERQEKAIVSRVPAKASAPTIDAVWTDGARWDRELAQDLYQLDVLTATEWAMYVAGELEIELVPELMYDWLSGHARKTASDINFVTRTAVEGALNQEDFGDAVKGVFDTARSAWAPAHATTEVTTAASFGTMEAAKQSPYTQKVWQVNSSNPRASHAAMNGETVAVNERFSNGLLYPGDPSGGSVDERAGCQCSVGFRRE